MEFFAGFTGDTGNITQCNFFDFTQSTQGAQFKPIVYTLICPIEGNYQNSCRGVSYHPLIFDCEALGILIDEPNYKSKNWHLRNITYQSDSRRTDKSGET